MRPTIRMCLTVLALGGLALAPACDKKEDDKKADAAKKDGAAKKDDAAKKDGGDTKTPEGDVKGDWEPE